MTLCSLYDDSTWRVAVTVGDLGGLVALDVLALRLRRRVEARTVYVIDGARWISEAEAVRLIGGHRHEARLLAELADALGRARAAALQAVQADALRAQRQHAAGAARAEALVRELEEQLAQVEARAERVEVQADRSTTWN